jgi:polyhydroxyalkanoate synthase
MARNGKQSGETEGAPRISPYAVRDPEAFARNLALALEQGARALAAYLQPYQRGGAAGGAAETILDIATTLARVGVFWTSDPARLFQAQTRLFARYLGIWQQSVLAASGDGAAGLLDLSKEKRFSDPEWRQNPVFSALLQVYLATAGWAEELIEQADGVDERTRHKAGFYLKQINNALSPANFVLTNPEVLKLTAETNAENLRKGMAMLAEDIAEGRSVLRPRHTDQTAFKLGENIAATPGKVVFQNDICQVLQYDQASATVLKRPLLIVPPWINKFYVLDLAPEKSLIRWLLKKGHTVFVISWINPDERHADKDFADYVAEGVLPALDVMQQATGEKRVNAIGYCVGGTLLAATLGYLAADGDERIASATLLAAQVDFEHAGDLKVFANADRIASLEAEMAKTGYLEGSRMTTAFNLLRSHELIWPYVVNSYLKGEKPAAFDLLYWNADATRMPRANHAFYLRSCYVENQLSQGRMKLAGRSIDLSKVKIPVYNLATKEDHIAPARSVFVGSASFGGPVRFVLAGIGAHRGRGEPAGAPQVSILGGRRAQGDAGRVDESCGRAAGLLVGRLAGLGRRA